MCRPIEILLVEDNPGDARLVRKALEQASVACNVSVAEDGVAALSFLRGQGEHAAAPRVDLVLLDLNLPRKDGREVLAEIKQDEQLKSIPVVVLSSSSSSADILISYGLHANGYITKWRDLTEYQAVMSAIESFWLKAATLPSGAKV